MAAATDSAGVSAASVTLPPAGRAAPGRRSTACSFSSFFTRGQSIRFWGVNSTHVKTHVSTKRRRPVRMDLVGQSCSPARRSSLISCFPTSKPFETAAPQGRRTALIPGDIGRPPPGKGVLGLEWSGTENLVWSWGGCRAGGLEPEAAAARRFDETRATEYSLVSHGPVFRKWNT